MEQAVVEPVNPEKKESLDAGNSTGLQDTQPLDRLAIRLKDARLQLGWTQKQTARVLGVSQAQVSDYENTGAGLTVQKVRDLEERLERKTQELNRMGESARGNPSTDPDQRPYDDLYFADLLQITVNKWNEWKRSGLKGESHLDIFLFGSHANDLPVFRDSTIQKSWAEILQKGANCHLLWPLDALSSIVLQSSFETLARLVQDPRAAGSQEAGSLVVHGVLLNNGQHNSEVGETYRKLTNSSLKGFRSSRLKVFDDPTTQMESYRRWLRLLRQGGTAPTVLCFVSKDPSDAVAGGFVPPQSFAARREAGVSFEPFGPPQTRWLFLDRDATDRLVADISEEKLLETGRT
jgi:transcriptional regulator with XRE-family HTH domain